ncbi:MAG: succinate dehydrogenase cytochrome b558 subunit [Parachlamydia sp.]|nr:succinate dehydrogenase cytochrome b558 subunit [Parachlamydia sp.]
MTASFSIPKAFIARRLHSLTGLFITLYLIEHLLVNSQAALWIGEDGSGFVRAVNSIQNLPYLPLIEIFLLAVPILIHMWWGIQYLQTSASNSWRTDGSIPALPEYPRNQAYTWQRITSWILLVGIMAHVVHMRFYEHPASAQMGTQKNYMVRLDRDAGLETLAPRLGFKLLDQTDIAKQRPLGEPEKASPVAMQEYKQKLGWVNAVEKRPLQEGQVIAVTDNFGMAELLMVRETFKMPLMLALYTIFVLSACFHGFNGLWTFMISWGITMNETSQRIMRTVSTGLMCLVGFMGLAAIWGTYWINLKY